ncbi:MAG: glycosyltransferase family 2 protein [Actinomycetaceae bacterium]|nr:glycosyltransferase family 2 protein [Actinomycetaceae bacterium]
MHRDGSHSDTLRRISVIIPIHRRQEGLRNLLEDLTQQTHLPSEVILVNSKQGISAQDLIEVYKQRLHVQEVFTDNWIGKKRTIGAAHATSELLVFLDDDVRIKPKHLEIFSAALHQNPQAVYCGGVVFPPEWVKQSNYYKYKLSRHFANSPGSRGVRKTLPGYNFVSMNFAIMKSVWNTIGGMREEFKQYGDEDLEFGYRTIRKGFTVFLVPEAECVHEEVKMTISTFVDKIHLTAGESSRLLQKFAPESRDSLLLRLTREEIRDVPVHIKVARLGLKLLDKANVNHWLVRYLQKTDGKPQLYSPALYNAAVLLANSRRQQN